MYGIDRKTLYIIIGVLIALTLVNMGTFNIVATLLTLPGVILAMSFHEFAHAFAADRLGDSTPRNQGRLTLDPMKHIDPVGIFLLIFAHIGWGRPVQINPNNFSKVSREKGETIVSLAGPLMNFILAFVLMIIFYLLAIFIPNTGILKSLSGINVMSVIMTMLYYAIVVNVGLGVFNLIPIPPLDGSKVLNHFLPYNAKQWFYKNEQIFTIVFFLLLFIRPAGVSVISRILTPIIGGILNGFVWVVSSIFGLFF